MARRKREDEALRTEQRYAGVLLVLALIALGVSIYLAYIHLRHGLEPDFVSACAIAPGIGCDAVISSPYGSIAGVPLAVLGVWFYGVSAVLAASALGRGQARFPHRVAPVLFVTSAFATVLSVGLAVLSVVELRAVCVLCATLYALNVAMLAVAFVAVRASGAGVGSSLSAEWSDWKANAGPAFWWWAKAFAALGVVVVGARAGLTSPDLCSAVLAAETGRSEPVTMIVYGDFQCPACRALHGELRSLRRSSVVRIMLRQYPLDRDCNPNVSATLHPGACLQARAALCAGEQGRYEDYSDHLFDERLADESGVRRLATSLQLDVPRFEACLGSDKTAEALKADIDAAIGEGIEGTPSMRVGGKLRLGGLNPEELACLRPHIGS